MCGRRFVKRDTGVSCTLSKALIKSTNEVSVIMPDGEAKYIVDFYCEPKS